jgi:lipopolysaccharide/colanic/teichoic acid biosynthesis glycosyltransferase
MVMHKFRTMRANAEAATGPVWTAAKDPRRTWIGQVLRRFSLDELPQLWNVIAGEMSLVGPRPERPVFVEDFKAKLERYTDRHLVRPGLTGWAQVNDLRGQTSVEERLIYDLYYIENWSIAFDLKIILITLFRVFTHKNAY